MMVAAKTTSRGSLTRAKWFRLFADHLPGYDPVATAAEGDWFDVDSANIGVAFFAECLVFIEGGRAGEPFVLEDWQAAIIGALRGWKRAGGRRRYREGFIYVPRKNGKTALMAGLVDMTMFCDHEPGAQIYSAAADREQASLVFRHAAGMIEREPELSSRCVIHKSYKSIEYPAEAAVYKALSSEAGTKHGLSPSMAVIDELHAHRSSELMDVIATGMGTREEPLLVNITTADFDRESACNIKHDYATKVRDGVIDDPSFLPVIYEASADDDWTDEATWIKCNPNYGVSVQPEFLRRECQRAQDQPSFENTFKRLHLNLKTSTDAVWLDMQAWDACGDTRSPDLSGRPCYGGLDLASRSDFAAFMLAFPPVDEDPRWRFKQWLWVPERTADKRDRSTNVPYMQWANAGDIILTDGDRCDYRTVQRAIEDAAHDFDLKDIGADRWNLEFLRQELNLPDDVEVYEFGQGFRSMSEPTKELGALVASRDIRHDGNPALRWMASNTVVEEDAAGNLKPSKRKSSEKIDGIVAMIMAIGRGMMHDGDEQIMSVSPLREWD